MNSVGVRKGHSFIRVALRADTHNKLRRIAESNNIPMAAFLDTVVSKLFEGKQIELIKSELPEGKASLLDIAKTLENINNKIDRLYDRVRDHQHKLEAIEILMPVKISNKFGFLVNQMEGKNMGDEKNKEKIEAKYDKIVIDPKTGKPVEWEGGMIKPDKVDEAGREKARKARAARMKNYEEKNKDNKSA